MRKKIMEDDRFCRRYEVFGKPLDRLSVNPAGLPLLLETSCCASAAISERVRGMHYESLSDSCRRGGVGCTAKDEQ